METALITGASSGIGLHLAREFAQHGHPVILTAPVEAELQSIAQDFRNKFNVTARVIAKDLEEPKAAQEIFEELQASNVRDRYSRQQCWPRFSGEMVGAFDRPRSFDVAAQY